LRLGGSTAVRRAASGLLAMTSGTSSVDFLELKFHHFSGTRPPKKPDRSENQLASSD
jgi:hypothetical protein